MLQDFYSLNRKGMVFVSRMYSKLKDGEFGQNRDKRDRKYVGVRIGDELRNDTKDNFWTHNVKEITDDLYMVTGWVKKDSKKYNALKRLGFNEIEGLV